MVRSGRFVNEIAIRPSSRKRSAHRNLQAFHRLLALVGPGIHLCNSHVALRVVPSRSLDTQGRRVLPPSALFRKTQYAEASRQSSPSERRNRGRPRARHGEDDRGGEELKSTGGSNSGSEASIETATVIPPVSLCKLSARGAGNGLSHAVRALGRRRY
jgi:hypothetical protein